MSECPCSPSNIPPKLDFTAQAQNQLTLVINQALSLYGLPCQVYSPITANNGYEGVYPEFTESVAPTGQCLVLVSQPVEGINLTNFISLSDKVEKNVRVTTTFQLIEDNQLVVHFPDKKLNLRVTAALTFHAESTINFFYDCVVM